VLTVGPVLVSASCQPGENPGDVKLTLTETIVEPVTVVEMGWDQANGKTTEQFMFDSSLPAIPSLSVPTNILSSGESATGGDLTMSGAAGVTWLQLVDGGVGSTAVKGVAGHCYAAGIEI
jgi:hypothetical protein